MRAMLYRKDIFPWQSYVVSLVLFLKYVFTQFNKWSLTLLYSVTFFQLTWKHRCAYILRLLTSSSKKEIAVHSGVWNQLS